MSVCLTCELSSLRQRSNPSLRIAACLTSAAASFSVRLTSKIGNKRFRFGGNCEPQFMWSLVIGHPGNSWPPSPLNLHHKHNASRSAVTAVTAGKRNERYD